MSDERYKDENPDEFAEEMKEILNETQESLSEAEPLESELSDELNEERDLFSQENEYPVESEVEEDETSEEVDSEPKAEEEITVPIAEDISEGIEQGLDKTTEVIEDVGEKIAEGAGSVVDKTSEIGENILSGAAIAVGAIGAGIGLGNKSEQSESSLVDQDIPSVLRPKDIFNEKVEENDEKLEEANTTISQILSRLKEKNFTSDYGILGYLISFPLLLAVVWQFIQKGATIRLGVVVLLAIFYLIYRAMIKGNARRVLELKRKIQLDHQNLNTKKGLFAKIDYVIAGIDLNVQRIVFTKWLFVIFTPFLLHFGREIWKGDLDGGTTFWLLMIAFGLSAILWPLVFNRDIKLLKNLETELFDLRRTFNS